MILRLHQIRSTGEEATTKYRAVVCQQVWEKTSAHQSNLLFDSLPGGFLHQLLSVPLLQKPLCLFFFLFPLKVLQVPPNFAPFNLVLDFLLKDGKMFNTEVVRS